MFSSSLRKATWSHVTRSFLLCIKTGLGPVVTSWQAKEVGELFCLTTKGRMSVCNFCSLGNCCCVWYLFIDSTCLQLILDWNHFCIASRCRFLLLPWAQPSPIALSPCSRSILKGDYMGNHYVDHHHTLAVFTRVRQLPPLYIRYRRVDCHNISSTP